MMDIGTLQHHILDDGRVYRTLNFINNYSELLLIYLQNHVMSITEISFYAIYTRFK